MASRHSVMVSAKRSNVFSRGLLPSEGLGSALIGGNIGPSS